MRRSWAAAMPAVLILLTVAVAGAALQAPAPVHAAAATRHPLVAAAGSPLAAAAAQLPPLAFSESWLGPHPSPELDVHMAAAVLVDLDTRQVLWEREPRAARAPASLVKLMTVLVALDHAGLTSEVTIPAEAVDGDPWHTTMGLGAGEVVTLRELLYGIFLVSGNDAAEALAQSLVPRAQFVAEMNAKAAALGLTGTHFENPTGLDQAGQVSTAADVALLTGYFQLTHGDLLVIAQQPSVVLAATPSHPEYDLVNLNKLVLWPYPGATGLKTGFTGSAGGCVAATAERDGRHLAAVVLGSDVMFSDAAALFDYGFGTSAN